MSDAPRKPPEPTPPSSQEEVLASAFAALSRFLDVARRAADRAAESEGPAGDAFRAARDAVRSARESAPRLTERPGPGDGKGPGPGHGEGSRES